MAGGGNERAQELQRRREESRLRRWRMLRSLASVALGMQPALLIFLTGASNERLVFAQACVGAVAAAPLVIFTPIIPLTFLYYCLAYGLLCWLGIHLPWIDDSIAALSALGPTWICGVASRP
jgi:hypothetical protein